MTKTLGLAALAAVCLGAHCQPIDGCVLDATRCAANTAEVCNAVGRYHELMDCDLVSEQSGAPFDCACTPPSAPWTSTDSVQHAGLRPLRFVDETTEDGHISGHTCVPVGDDGAAGGAR